MSLIQLTIQDPQKEFYACSTKQCFDIIALLPIQRVGLAPMRVFEGCSCSNCGNNILTVFSGSGSCTNDKSAYLFDFPTAAGNDFRLEKYDYSTSNWIDIDSVNGLGTFYPFGVFASYPKRSGFEVEWNQIFDLYGGGTYRFTLTPTIQPDPLNPVVMRSYTYNLQEYSCQAAQYTVKVQTEFTGEVTNLLFAGDDNATPHDLLDMIWKDELRYRGSFGRYNPIYRDTYIKQSSNRNFLHKNFNEPTYTLDLPTLDVELYRRLTTYGKDSTTIKVTDYSDTTGYNYTTHKVKINEGSSEQVPKQKTTNATIQCSDGFDIEFFRR